MEKLIKLVYDIQNGDLLDKKMVHALESKNASSHDRHFYTQTIVRRQLWRGKLLASKILEIENSLDIRLVLLAFNYIRLYHYNITNRELKKCQIDKNNQTLLYTLKTMKSKILSSEK